LTKKFVDDLFGNSLGHVVGSSILRE
jgi:hypothetical protein